MRGGRVMRQKDEVRWLRLLRRKSRTTRQSPHFTNPCKRTIRVVTSRPTVSPSLKYPQASAQACRITNRIALSARLTRAKLQSACVATSSLKTNNAANTLHSRMPRKRGVATVAMLVPRSALAKRSLVSGCGVALCECMCRSGAALFMCSI